MKHEKKHGSSHERTPPRERIDGETDDATPIDETPGREGGSAGEDAGTLDAGSLLRERDEYLANWKRSAADYQNLRRRLQADIDAAIARRKAALLGDLLLVLDYLDMALATPVETTEGKTLHAGVDATRTAMLGALEREGVKPIPEGGRFDPAVHACVATDDASGKPPGEILATLRPGYTLDGKILRPAQVRVAGDAGNPAGNAGENAEEG